MVVSAAVEAALLLQTMSCGARRVVQKHTAQAENSVAAVASAACARVCVVCVCVCVCGKRDAGRWKAASSDSSLVWERAHT